MEQGIKFNFTGDSSGVETASAKTVNSLNKVKTAAAPAVTTFTNMGRVLQDLPFGMIGIANNISPLFESFGRLNTSAGGLKNTLLALGTSLTGAGGLILASSALTFIMAGGIPKIKEWLGALTGGEDKVERTNKLLAESRAQAQEYAKALGQAADSVGNEFSRVSILVGKLQEGNLTRKETTAVIKELQQIAPDYFGKLDAEKSKIADIVTAYDKYNATLLKSVENKVKLAELENTVSERLKLQTELVKKGFLSKENNAALGVFANSVESVRATLEKFPSVKIENLFPFGTKDQGKVQQFARLLRQEINGIADLSKNADLKTLGVSFGQAGKGAAEAIDRIRHAKILNQQELANLQLMNEIISGHTPEKKAAVEPTGPIVSTLQLPGGSKEDEERLKRTLGWLKEMKPALVDIGQVITSVGGAFEGLFESLMSGSKSAFAAFAQALGQIIKKLIATAAASLLLTAILGPLGVVKSGTTALKGFDLFKNIFSKLGGFAEGGVASGPKSGYPAMLHGTEVITPIDKFMNMVNGNRQTVLIPEPVVIRSGDIYIAFKQGERNAGRVF